MKPSLTQWVAQQRAALGLPPAAETTALTAEASHRRFYRQRAPAALSLIVMDSPPELERNQAFVELAGVFAQAALPVPRILAQDLSRGFVAMTDVGDRDLLAAYQAGAQEPALQAALEGLLQLQPVVSPHIGPYSGERLLDELGIFAEWFVEKTLNLPFPSAELLPLFQSLVNSAQQQPQVCVHRDYHCRNLLFSEAGEFGIVDFQDALHGPLTYDLASLLRDCYYPLPEPVVGRWCEWFRRHAAPDIAPVQFAQQMDWMAVQRQLKAVGIFVRLQWRDNKASHLAHVLPTLAQIERLASRYPPLMPLAKWLQQHEPVARRKLQQLQQLQTQD